MIAMGLSGERAAAGGFLLSYYFVRILGSYLVVRNKAGVSFTGRPQQDAAWIQLRQRLPPHVSALAATVCPHFCNPSSPEVI